MHMNFPAMKRPSPRRGVGLVLVGPALIGLVGLVLSGCLSKPALRKELFLVTPAAAPAAAAKATTPRSAEVVRLSPVSVAAPFTGRSLVYRVSETAYEIDSYAEFLVAPERMLDGAVRQWLRRSGAFQDVLDPGSQVSPTRLAELHVTEFYGDFRSTAEPAGVVTLRLTLLPVRGPTGAASAPTTREVTRRVRANSRTATAVVESLQQALGEALSELTK